MAEEPLVSIIIPHLQGKETLVRCLNAVQRTAYPNRQVILVDNATTDGSLEGIEQAFPWLQVVHNLRNLGYAGGCNSALPVAEGKYVLFLNDDTDFEPGWLAPLVAACEADERIAACQPKIVQQDDPAMFDYAGAAGGLLDVFGYPFARGRVFFALERDAQQYDDGGDIFWASGTATLVRRSALQEVGAFDEDFFAHMEEIDLDWRLHLAGYRVVAVPQSVVRHRAGSTLPADSPRKILLNHRNSLLMLLKNYSVPSLLRFLPGRLLLEWVTVVYSLFRLDFVRARSVLLALIQVAAALPRTLRKRSEVRKLRRVPDREILEKMYRGSIVFQYF
ncbi:MAG: glycosyltransferase family 2 protein, partial [Calditrichaeota bacterium]